MQKYYEPNKRGLADNDRTDSGYYRYRGGLDLHIPLCEHVLGAVTHLQTFLLTTRGTLSTVNSNPTTRKANMNIQFDTNSTSEGETRALIAFLSALLPSTTGQVQSAAPSLTKRAQRQAAAPATLNEQLKASLALEGTQAAGPVLVETAPGTTEPAKRTRRTKEQIAADEAAKQAPQAAPAAETSVQHVNGSAKIISADELRALLNGYIARHGMEAAIDRLKAFGCNRVTEALALESVKLNELAASLNG